MLQNMFDNIYEQWPGDKYFGKFLMSCGSDRMSGQIWSSLSKDHFLLDRKLSLIEIINILDIFWVVISLHKNIKWRWVY